MRRLLEQGHLAALRADVRRHLMDDEGPLPVDHRVAGERSGLMLADAVKGLAFHGGSLLLILGNSVGVLLISGRSAQGRVTSANAPSPGDSCPGGAGARKTARLASGSGGAGMLHSPAFPAARRRRQGARIVPAPATPVSP